MKKYIFWLSVSVSVLTGTALVYFFFVPAFAGKIIISPVIDLGIFTIRWYGLMIALAVLTGFLVARKYAWKFGIDARQLTDFAFWLVIVSGIGARLYFVIFEFNYFVRNPLEIVEIWHGGISIYGAVISGFVFAFFYARRKAYSSWQLMDLTALSLPLAQAVGRFGNFFNQEAFGLPTNLPWKMFVGRNNRPLEFVDADFFHPTFLYEAIWNVIVFFVLLKLVGRHKSGVLAFAYLMSYSLGRFFIEGIRLDSALIMGFRSDQVIALIIFLFAGFMIYRLSRTPQQ
ncbi:MAG: prolipoprotein diacylglyceryl transferase [Candidatus Doudnabacteria bacterium]|nr:prolipoprotein diacylglyceryl transferase [Candidatus Doudnabacteria bacterium]